MATRKDDRAPRTPRRGGRGRSALPAKNLINKNPRTQKLTIAERDYMLECFAKGWPPAKVREAMRQRGILNTPTLVSVAGAARTNAEEIAQRKARWYAQLRGEPLAQPRDRLRERIKMYNLCILGQFREACPGCGGEGKVPALVPPVGADVPASAEANIPPENSQGPGISHPTQSPQQPYNLDDTLRQGANKSGDYYQP